MLFQQTIKIGNKLLGEGQPVFIIAEAGVSHFGSLEKAYELVDMAVAAKADAVKFQIFKSENMISSELPEWRERMSTRELPYEDFRKIQSYCRQKNIMFLATAHDEPSFDFLVSLDVPAYKIGSGEVNNWPFLRKIAAQGKPVILSTGMYSFDDILGALNVFSQSGNRDLAILHCVTAYPVPPAEANLNAIVRLRDKYPVIVGYSDHTAGHHIPLAAVALGARIIEKHITLEFNIPNAQDWKVSCGPQDLSDFVSKIRDIEVGLGTGEKSTTPAEENSLLWARKSLVVNRALKAGEAFTEEILTSKRPGTGITPSEIAKVIGRKANKDLLPDQVLRWEDLT